MHLFLRKLCLDLIQLLSQIRVSQPARSNGQLLRLHRKILRQCLKRFCYLGVEKTQHAHAILQLRVSVVTLRLRQLPFCQNIEFITGMDEVHAILLIYDFLPFFNDINGILCIFLLKGL